MANRDEQIGDEEDLRLLDTISVAGFKSLAQRQEVKLRPLTLLAGANSSGKSSLMQALLLLKQTVEATYDPGVLLLNGPNVKFTAVEQMLSKGRGATEAAQLRIGGVLVNGTGNEIVFQRGADKRLEVSEFHLFAGKGKPEILTPDMSEKDILALPELQSSIWRQFHEKLPHGHELRCKVVRDRCFLRAVLELHRPNEAGPFLSGSFGETEFPRLLQKMIHLPGLRGNPERAYPRAATGPEFPGTFEKYTASFVAQWGEAKSKHLVQLSDDMKDLGLTWKVAAKQVEDSSIEVQVGRMPTSKRGAAHDLVNIADVGFGVSQVLPVIVALLAARKNQLVYIEQPEIHLHPRAQVQLARLLARAANRGVQVVAETHSSLLLLGVQALVAEGEIPPDKVQLHWFSRDENTGVTEISSAELDEAGRFGEWPTDFDDVSLETQMEYLNASQMKQSAHE